ncbi:hypothetical protein JCM11641_002822 [Rhodosporidiobolus odoratus]
MSADAPPKRAHSTSPPPPVPAAASLGDTTVAHDAKRLKLATDEQHVATTLPKPAAAVEASTSAVASSAKQPPQANSTSSKKAKKVRGRKVKPPKPGGAEEAAAFDIIELLGEVRVKELEKKVSEDGWDAYEEAVKEWGKDANGKDVEIKVVGISDHGDGLALLTPASETAPTRLLTIPFTLPGELVRVHIHRHEPELFLSHGDLLEILEKSPERALAEGEVVPELETEKKLSEQGKKELQEARNKFGPRVQCRYYGRCSGCQYQPLSHEKQLELKQDVVRRAFANFSGLPSSLVPSIGPTLPSPLQYGYRTKLTPHFDTPPTSNPRGGRKKGVSEEEVQKAQEKKRSEWQLRIGFEQKGRKMLVDIEECPIASSVINSALPIEREKVKTNLAAYKRGATLLLRDSLPSRDPSQVSKPVPYVPSSEAHICITDHHATVREQVGTIEFEQQAGSFFQNNSSILPSLMDTVKEAIGPRRVVDGKEEERFLVDAYTGSGLFAISLADLFDKVEGVEIDKASIKWAKRNAEFNKGEGRGEVGFRDGKAEAIFKDITFPSARSVCIIDPPRKGCDDLFLDQLLRFGPASIVYISCNVRTQARDIGYLVRKSSEASSSSSTLSSGGYRIETCKGADFFSASHHVESFAVLRRIQ